MPDEEAPASPAVCPDCGTEISPVLLSCPRCRRLVHAETLKELSERADRAEDLTTALETWRRVQDLLPPDSRQYEAVVVKIDALSRKVEQSPPDKPTADRAKGKSGLAKGAAGVGALGLLIWKFKFILGFVLTKGKLLLLGLTKFSTVFSMFLSMAAYWSIWGWKFAVGLVISIYIHEMGHVAMLRRYGIRASAPMFIPGIGAFVRLKQYPANRREDARVGLAGPIWGLGAALGAWLVFLATGWASWGAIARVAAWINLFNLIPVWQLDGSRGFRSLTRAHRWLIVLAAGGMWFATERTMVLLVFFGAAFRMLGKDAPEEPDTGVLVQFVGLILALSAFCMIEVPVPILG